MARSASPLPPLSVLKDNFAYCPDSGVFYHAKNKSGRNAPRQGDICEGKTIERHQLKYSLLCVRGKWYRAHRVAWKMHYGVEPCGVIDHINGNGQDNRLSNLRDVSRSVNLRNINTPVKSSAGVRGVSFDKRRGCFYARIQTESGTQKNLGTGDLLHCVALRKSAEQRLGYL